MLRTLLLTIAFTALLPAQDDRDRTTPTATIWKTGQSTADLTTLTSAGWRFTDIEIESTSPWSFTVAAVANTGAYQKGWIYSIGVTAAQLGTTLSQNNARLVDVEPYVDNGTTRFVAIMIGNSGADAKTWWWGYDMTSAQVDASVSANGARLTNLERYTKNGQTLFAVTMIANTGADFRNWGYLYGASSATINQNVAQYGNRIYDLEHVATDSYDAILVQNVSGFGNWYYFDQTAAQVTELLQQNLGRIIDVERHVTLIPPSTRYHVVMLDNGNPLEQLARQKFFTALPGALGDYGFFLKEVNGPVLAEMRADTPFEPASTMKTLYHVHAMKQVKDGLASLGELIDKPIFCGVAGGNQTLEQTLAEMMEYSDNMSTLAISNRFGLTNIDATAGALGMTSTSVNFTIGCSGPDPENTLTLRDLSRLHEQVVNGYLGPQRPKFYELMQESLAFPSNGNEDLDDRIVAEALVLGMPTQVRDAFMAALHLAYKPGGVGWFHNGDNHYYYAEGGWMSVPFKDAAGQIVPREYTYGVFNYDYHVQEYSGRDAMFDAELELVWDRVRAAMLTWNDHHVSGSLVPLIGAGCAGSAGTPLHGASGSPELFGSVAYDLANAPANAIYVALFGFSATDYQGIPLPLNLAVIGAPSCLLRTSVDVQFAGLASAGGTATTVIPMGGDPATIGVVWYSQYLVLDPPANAFGATLSNAFRTTVGGWL